MAKTSPIVAVCVIVAILSAIPALSDGAEAVTNKPCVDVTSTEPYGFPLTVDCPFSMDKKLLDEAVKMARQESKLTITKARAGHMSHPGWCPGVVFFYEPYRTNQQSVSLSLYVYFGDPVEKREPGKASCGRDLITISSATLRASPYVVTNEVFEIKGSDILANVRCFKEERQKEENTIHLISMPTTKKARADIQSLLESLSDDKYLNARGDDEIKTIVGKVYPGDREKEIIPAKLAKTAFGKLDSTLELDDLEESEVDLAPLHFDGGSLLRRGRWDESMGGSYIEYDVGSGDISVRNYTSKYSARESSFRRLDGIWVKYRQAMIRH